MVILKTILLIDDEPVQLRLVDQILSSHGYRVIKAGSGEEGIHKVYESKPDIVILDVMMSGIDGWQTCRCIREASDVPVIMLTGKRTNEDDIVHGLECGADEYLTKPVGNRELLARVRAALRRADKSSTQNGKKPLISRTITSPWMLQNAR